MRKSLTIAASFIVSFFSIPALAQRPEVLSLQDSEWSAYSLSTSDQATRLGLQGLKAAAESLAPPIKGVFDGHPNALNEQNPQVRIHYRMYENPQESQGGVVIVSGRTEGLALYQETIADLLRNGWSVYIYDHRGQGFSTRLLGDASQASKGHIDQFHHYVADLSTFTQMVSARRVGSPRPMVLLAHSMGGAISSLYLANYSHPYKAAAMITPMHQPWLAGPRSTLKSRVADFFCRKLAFEASFNLFDLSSAYIADEDFDNLQQGMEEDSVTSSPERLKLNWLARADTCSGDACGHSNAKVGGPTVRWLNQACSAAQATRGVDSAKIQMPVLVFQGEKDSVVNGEAQQEFCTQVNAGKKEPVCKLVVVPNGRHALHIERDEIRRPVLGTALRFMACVASGSRKCF